MLLGWVLGELESGPLIPHTLSPPSTGHIVLHWLASLHMDGVCPMCPIGVCMRF